MKILMLVDWQVARLETDSYAIPSPNKQVINCHTGFLNMAISPHYELYIIDSSKCP